MVKLPVVDKFNAKERLGIGVAIIFAADAISMTGFALYRVHAYLILFGWAFLGTAFIPPFVARMNVNEWDDISTMKQIGILWIAAIGALVLWFAISVVGGTALRLVL